MRLIPSLLALTLATAFLSACSATGTTSRVEHFVGGPDAVALLADRTTGVTRAAYRIDGQAFLNGTAKDAQTTLHGYPVLAGPAPVDDASAALLADVLLDDATYLWDLAKACEFLPGVVVRQTRGDTTVDVLICFSCDELEVVVNGKETGHEDFDPRRADLVRMARTLFPDDAKIHALR